MQRCPCLETVIHVIDDVPRCENNVHAYIAQRQMQDRGRVLEQLRVRNIRFGGGGGKKDQRGVAYRILQTIPDVRPKIMLSAKPAAEALRLCAVEIIQADLLKLPVPK